MKKMILPPGISVVILLVATCGLAQDLDLIVTTKGDSIACRIDSITETHIYFEMKSQNKWAHTQIGLTDVSEYKRSAIDRKKYVFKAGTSIIESPKTASPASIRDIQRNSVYVGILTVNYSRMIPGDRVGFTVAGGISFIAGGLLAETTILIGGTKHFFEPGFGAYCGFEIDYDEGIDYNSLMFMAAIRTGYRYQGPEGFLFRVAPLFGVSDGDFGILPALSIGYSF